MQGSRATGMSLPTFHHSDTGEAGLSTSLSGDGQGLIRPGWANSSLALPTLSILPGPHLTFQAFQLISAPHRDGPSRPRHPSPIRHMRRRRQGQGRERQGKPSLSKAQRVLAM